ncbi:helix-turn-helix transcriptional regulator [Curtobacterium luteum]|uniref:helix-turn-helix transcriptional regulator n=1 Tax=Curtobacterium luteum TaxID=33881 RepID=UPI00382D4F28
MSMQGEVKEQGTAAEQTPGRRAWLGDFLRARREALQPEDVGLPRSGRRRTPGLRREEVAVLANVGVSWYTWLEQGRDIGVSTVVVDAIADALRLDGADLECFYELTGKVPASRRAAADDLKGALERMLSSIQDMPAYAADRYWNVFATNELAAKTFQTQVGTNCLVRYFTDESYAAHYPHRDIASSMMVSQFRRQATAFPNDPVFESIASDLADRSPEFARHWRQHSVGQEPHVATVFDHPLGRMSFETVVLTPAVGGDDLMLFLYSPSPVSAASTLSILEQIR